MHILFVIQAAHYRIGCHHIADRYREIAHRQGIDTSLMIATNHDGKRDDDWHSYASTDLAKKTYDAVFVFESAPPARWGSSIPNVWWVPMIEFVTHTQMRNLDSSVHIVWHSRAGLNAGLLARPTIDQAYVPFGLSLDVPRAKRTGRRKVLIHSRARCLDCERLATLLLKNEDIEVIYWDNLRIGAGSVQDHPRVRMVRGIIDRGEYLNIVSEASVYVSTRSREGVGLCVLEAALCGCVIACPKETTVGEYFPDRNVGGVPVSLCVDQQDDLDWLCPRYEWTSSSGDSLHALADTIIDIINDPGIDSVGYSARKRAEELSSQFESSVSDIFRTIKPQNHVFYPRSRRRILSIQTCRWGGQALHELWTIRELSKASYNSVFSTCLWIQNFDPLEHDEHCRLLEASSVRLVAPYERDMISVDPDIVILHWSSGAERLCLEEHMGELRSFLIKTRAVVVCFVHDVAPASWPGWLNQAIAIHPTNEAMDAYIVHDQTRVPRTVIPHFMDPDMIDVPIDRSLSSGFVIGVVGKVRWTKLDPLYRDAIRSFLDKNRSARVTWLGGPCDGYLEGDDDFVRSVRPTFVTAHGIKRFKHIDSMTVGIHLSGVQESFCYSAHEMISRGVPVITNRYEIMSSLGDACILIGGPSELTMVLDRMRTSPEFYARMKAEAHKSAGKMITWTIWRERFHSIIGNAMRLTERGRVRWSVIVPARNVGRWIERCLSSIIANSPSQIVVVIDHSDDDTDDRVKQIAESSDVPIMIAYTDAGRQSACWKQGYELCTGDLIAFVDGDDEMHHDALDEMTRVYMSEPDTMFAWSDQYVVDDATGALSNDSFSCQPSGSILDSVLSGSNTFSHLITARRSILSLIDIDGGYPCSADKDIGLKMEEVGKGRYVSKKLYIYRANRPGSVTATRKDDQERCKSMIIEEAIKRRSGGRTGLP